MAGVVTYQCEYRRRRQIQTRTGQRVRTRGHCPKESGTILVTRVQGWSIDWWLHSLLNCSIGVLLLTTSGEACTLGVTSTSCLLRNPCCPPHEAGFDQVGSTVWWGRIFFDGVTYSPPDDHLGGGVQLRCRLPVNSNLWATKKIQRNTKKPNKGQRNKKCQMSQHKCQRKEKPDTHNHNFWNMLF